ncbi:MAG TPA: ECF-type sigma factor [Bryobacteraceae bacterium]
MGAHRGRLSIDPRTQEITNRLKTWGGDEAALAKLTERVYPELRLMARRYMKDEVPGDSSPAQSFAIATQMTRRILVDAARGRGSRRSDGIPLKVSLDESVILTPKSDRSILALDETLTAFSQVAPRQAKVVELRYFGGLTEEEVAAVLKISRRTVERDWGLAKAWLLRELSRTIGRPPGP